MQSLEEFTQQKWRDEATGRVHCINIEYFVNHIDEMLASPDDDTEDEDEPVLQIQPLPSKLDSMRNSNAISKAI
jgi:hypothetical protein